MLEHIARAVIDRRRVLGAAGSIALSAAAGRAAVSAASTADFNDPLFNVQAFAKISSTLASGETGFVHYSGKAFGIDPNGPVTPFYGIEGIGAIRSIPQDTGAIKFLFAECAIYTDLATGEPLETWINPWTNEKLPVWHQRNGPVNYEVAPGPSSKIGAFDKVGGAAKPFILPWTIDGDRATYALDTLSNRPNPLDPKLYPRESFGPTLNISEHSQYLVSAREIADPKVLSVNFFGALQSLKPWHPWMMMGPRPGKLFTRMVSRKVTGPADLPPTVYRYAKERFAEYLKAPEAWTGQYLTAYDLYKAEFPRTQNP